MFLEAPPANVRRVNSQWATLVGAWWSDRIVTDRLFVTATVVDRNICVCVCVNFTLILHQKSLTTVTHPHKRKLFAE
jgi:hypothetical protein